MVLIAEPASASFRHGRHVYVQAPTPIVFPSEEPWEEAVSETKRHLEARTTLYLLLKDAFAGKAIGSDQFVYWSASDPRQCLSPDVFVKLDLPDEAFETWKVWERGAPDVAVEIVSKSDQRDSDWGDTLARYQACGVGELVRFDADDASRSIRVWDRVDGELIERAQDDLHLRECMTLSAWWVVAPSAYGPQLRLARDPEGRELYTTPVEDCARLKAELIEERQARAVERYQHLPAEARAGEEAAARTQAEAQACEEATARTQAEAQAREEAAARTQAERDRDAALAENERLRAELARARGQ